jgi:hypothetical protein
MQVLNQRAETLERLRRRNKRVFVDAMNWFRKCFENGRRTTAGKFISQDQRNALMDELVAMKRI